MIPLNGLQRNFCWVLVSSLHLPGAPNNSEGISVTANTDAHKQNNLDDYAKFLEVPSHTEAAIQPLWPHHIKYCKNAIIITSAAAVSHCYSYGQWLKSIRSAKGQWRFATGD